jgi:general L-amino acid transport system permease protein
VHQRRWSWTAAARQAIAFAVLAGLLTLMFHLTSENLQSRGIQSGFDFLWKPATTPVYDSPLEFEAGVDTFGKAFAAGALHSLKTTVAATRPPTVIGVAVGLGRLSRNALARGLCGAYVEFMRNVPVLLHIFFWYGLVLELPAASEADSGGSLLLASNRGIFLAWWGMDAQGRWAFELPRLDGLEVTGGIFMTPEFFALFLGIALYTAAFVAEIVRASVGAVVRGQWEASAALGLSRGTVLRRIVFPQAFRVGVPSLTSEYLGIFKNSTLAVAIGYQDFMAVSNTMLTDTGQAVEVMAIVMLFYAVISLVVSAAMHVFEHRSMHWGVS